MWSLGLVGQAVAVPRAPADFAELGPARAAVSVVPPAAVQTDSWTLDPRDYAWPGQFTGCPEGQRNAVENECVAAVKVVAAKLGKPLEHHDLKVVDTGDDGWVPFGCSYSREHGEQQAVFNRNPTGRNTGSNPLVCSKLIDIEDDEAQATAADASPPPPEPEPAPVTSEADAAQAVASDKASLIPIGWTLDPRVYEEPGQVTGCPDGQRNAGESECLAAVQDALAAIIGPEHLLRVDEVRVVDDGVDGWVPSGCSYSKGHGQRAMWNRNPDGRSTASYPLVCIDEQLELEAEASAADEHGAHEEHSDLRQALKQSLFAIVTGLEGSGTTVLSSLIKNAPGVFGGFECGFLLAPEPSAFNASCCHPWDEWIQEGGDHMWNVSAKGLKRIRAADGFANMYARLILESPTLKAIPNVRVLDKTPRYAYNLPAVLRKAPGVPCVVSVRGNATDPSVYEALRLYPQRVLLVEHEALLAEPSATMRTVFAFLREHQDEEEEEDRTALRWEDSYLSMRGFAEQLALSDSDACEVAQIAEVYRFRPGAHTPGSWSPPSTPPGAQDEPPERERDAAALPPECVVSAPPGSGRGTECMQGGLVTFVGANSDGSFVLRGEMMAEVVGLLYNVSTHSILVAALDEYLETHTPTICVLVKMDEQQGAGRKRQAIDACTRAGALTVLDCVDNPECALDEHLSMESGLFTGLDALLVQTEVSSK